MDVNKELGTAAIFAQAVWILAGLYLYFTTPGASLLSNSAGAFLVGGFFASALIFGVTFYGLRRAINRAPVQVSKWVLTITEAVVIFVAAGLTFEQLEQFRAGVPLEYAQHRDDFDYALKAFSVASRLEEQAKTGRDTGQIDAAVETRLVELMEEGVSRGSRVSEEFLIYLDPELPQPYRTQLLRGHQLLAEGRRSGDIAKQTEGSELVQAFYQDFLPPKADAILAKMGVQPQ
ncbi:MAG TPA: hypothetical protein VL282_17275 [Tepidisphaeraceae bacterium]|nr:hypothetical protein [Tepidisphaeraceae bacterium]